MKNTSSTPLNNRPTVPPKADLTGSTPLNKLLIIGSVAYDSIQTPFGKIDKTLGGSASYFSLASRFFTRPSLIAVVGDDFKAGDVTLLKKHKVDVSGLQKAQGKTFHWAGKYHFDLNTRDTLKTELGVFEKFEPKLSENHKKSDYIFLGNIHPRLQLSVLDQIQKPKLVGLDTMNYWIEKSPKDLQKVLKRTDILIINDSEARELSKEHNLIKSAKIILKLLKQSKKTALIIKRGEYGLLMFVGGEIFNLPGYPLEDVADPTGAGDSFAGGFMGYLAKVDDISPDSLKQACVAGSVMASFCVEKLGLKRLQNLKTAQIQVRTKNFKNLTHFELKN